MNNAIDAVYLALELTKLNHGNSDTNEKTLQTYNYFFTELSGIENIGMIEELQKRNEELRIEIQRLKNIHLDDLHNNVAIKTIKNFIEDAKADMEPYIYNRMMDVISKGE